VNRDRNIPRLEVELNWETSILQLADNMQDPTPTIILPIIKKYMLGEKAIVNHPMMFGTVAIRMAFLGPNALAKKPPIKAPKSWPIFTELA